MIRTAPLLLPLLLACGRGAGSPLAVAEREDPAAEWACARPESCKADYLAFAARAAGYAAPIAEGALEQQLGAFDGGGLTPALAPGELAERIHESLGQRFLREGLDLRPLEVLVTRRTDSGSLHQEELLLRDPYVGAFQAILLEPSTGGPFPAVLALPGHGDDAARYRDLYGGGQYPGRGYAILILTSRVMNIDADEHEVAHALLRNGFTLIGLRAYEALLGLKYLRWRGDIAHEKIGLIGHSGGSSTGNLLVRIEPGFRAYVSDHQVDWGNPAPGEAWHCETVPALYPLNALISDFGSSATPVRKVTYGYPEGLTGIFTFFDRFLKR